MPARDEPKVAFIIPARNSARTLPATLKSATTQGIEQIEVVVVDDGSSDSTRDIVLEWSGRDSRVRLCPHGGSQGVAGARNTGLAASSAPLVCFLDSDDLVPPDKARIQSEVLNASQAIGVVYSPAVEFQGEDIAGATPVDMAKDHPSLERSLLTGGVAFPPHCALVRRSWIERVGGFDVKQFHEIEDTFFWVRLVLEGCRFEFVDMEPVGYRRHPGAKSANREMVLDARIRLASWLARRTACQDSSRREALASRHRYLSMILADLLAGSGRTREARSRALGLLSTSRNLGQVWEIVRFAWSPRAAESRRAHSTQRGDSPSPTAMERT